MTSQCQSIILKLYLSTGIASDPAACILCFALSSVFKTILIFLHIPFSILPAHIYVLHYSSCLLPNTYAFPVSDFFISFPVVFSMFFPLNLVIFKDTTTSTT
jgi:hypothetical protein